MLAVLSPGQGSQKPGFLDPVARPARRRGPAALVVRARRRRPGAPRHPGRRRRDQGHRRTQPLLVAAALLAAEQLPMYDVGAGRRAQRRRARPPPPSPGCCRRGRGHARRASAAGRWPPPARSSRPAWRRARRRPGRGARRDRAAGLYPANRNGAGQIVAAGALDAAGRSSPPSRRPGPGSSPLQVAGAFHTPYMAPAEEALAAVAGGITVADPARILLSNLDGAAVDHGREMLAAAGPPGHRAGALGPVHADAARPRRHRASSSCRRPARSPAWPSGSSAGRRDRHRSTRPTTCPPPAT